MHSLSRITLFVLALVALALPPRHAWAQGRDNGAVVVAIGATSSVAWGLAQAVYASSARPSIEEADARILAGEPPVLGKKNALAELRQAASGDDAPSRAIFGRILRDTATTQLAFVMRDESGGVYARIYRSDDSVDPESYFPSGDPKEPSSWRAAVDALTKRKVPLPVSAKPISSRTPSDESAKRSGPFYASPWFWGGIAAAALTGGAIYLATRDGSSGSGPIHLQVRVP